jgi:hypothetical protein
MSWASDWRASAKCKDGDTSAFFEAIEQRSPPRRSAAIKRAKAACRSCTVTRECLAAALGEEGTAPHGRYGIRGGKTPDERATLARTTNKGEGGSRA